MSGTADKDLISQIEHFVAQTEGVFFYKVSDRSNEGLYIKTEEQQIIAR
jgi:hypothetical protein